MGDALASALEPWAALYGDAPMLATAILGTHLLALFVGGGVAIAADRALLRATGAHPDDRPRVLAELGDTHPLVIRMLVVAVVTGALMAAADAGTYLASPVYWAKMTGFALLLANGVALRRAEAGAQSLGVALAERATPRATRALRVAAQRSLVGWGALVLLGVLLSNG